jgi:hypothetical protein
MDVMDVPRGRVRGADSVDKMALLQVGTAASFPSASGRLASVGEECWGWL